MELLNYSEKSIALVGPDTKKWKDHIKSISGAKYNANLSNKEDETKFAGWIFPTAQEETLKQFIEDVNDSMKIIKYSEKSVVLTGKRTKFFKDDIKKINGKYNSNLKDENGEKYCGWVFHVSQEESLKKFIQDK